MANDDEIDELLEAMERRAGRLKDESVSKLRETDAFGHTAIVKAGRDSPLPKQGDAIGENYEVIRVLGRSRESHVLLVRHRGVDREFAMKLLPQRLAQDEEQVERFQKEARAASKIGHENIVFVTDFGKSNQFGFYYVMEYLNGESLAERLDRESYLTADVVTNLALCAGGALAAAHELGVVHRDVRPQNFMSHVSEHGQETWKLLEFGLSTPVVPGSEALTMVEEPLYVAPEQAAGAPTDPRADQFSLCAVLYHCITGHPPWPNRKWTTATPDAWTEPVQTIDGASRMTVMMRKALMRGLSARPEDRFDSLDDFLVVFQRGSGRSRRPTLPPIDLQDAAQALRGQHANASVTIGLSFESDVSEVSEVSEAESVEEEEFHDPPSVEISLDMLPNARPKITMVFQTADRLRREWRRNLITGGLFVPTEKDVAKGAACILALRFAPTGAEASFPARVTETSDPTQSGPSGLAVQVQDALVDALHAFIGELDLELLDASTTLKPLRALTADANLTADQAFLLDRIRQPVRVGELRGMVQSLPIDFDETVFQLIDGGWIEIEGEGRARKPSSAGVVASENDKRDEFVAATLQRADFFRSQGNFMAEIETLQLATERQPDAEIFYRIGLSKVQFLNDIAGARSALQKAVELAPEEAKYQKALGEIERLLGE